MNANYIWRGGTVEFQLTSPGNLIVSPGMPLVRLEVELDNIISNILSIRNWVPVIVHLNILGEPQVNEHVGLATDAVELRIGQGKVHLELQTAAAVAPRVRN